MPINYKVYGESTLKTINSVQKAMKTTQFDGISEDGKLKVYADIFAYRASCDAVRKEKSTLKVPVNVEKEQAVHASLIQSESFKSFVKAQGHAQMKKMLTTGHGGAAEDSFQDYILQQDKLPADVPIRYMPKAKDRIEQQQKKLEGLDAKSKEAAAIYAEIFRARQAVGATRGKAASLEPKIEPDSYAKAPDLSGSATFQSFVQEKGTELKAALASGKGHGGAGEDLFKDYVLNLERIPADVPMAYAPEAKERCETLQKQMQSAADFKKRNVIYNELMATRESVGAVRGKKSSLETTVDPAALQKAYTKWESCATFQSYLREHDAEAREALLKGHGGALGDKFEEHVKNLDHIPADVPEESMPEAKDRLEAIQAKFKDVDYFNSTDERKLVLAAEIMGTRDAVGAERGKKSSLEKKIDPKKLQERCKKWSDCKAFQDFVKNEGAKVYDGAVAGHGGALGDKFTEYLVSRDELEADIPAEFMPTAQVRTEALQKKIRENGGSPAQNQKLYAELMATRSAVDAVRGKKGSLEPQLDPAKLDAERKQLTESDAFKAFIADPGQAAVIQNAALAGHGGALEDSFKDYVRSMAVIPANTPARYMPKALERAEGLQQQIRENKFPEEGKRTAAFVELMATREAVGAVRGKKDSLDKVIDPEALQKAREKWNACETFRNYVADNYEAQEGATAGHGGALMDKFKEYVKDQDYLPEDLPEEVIPNADERIEALQKQFKEDEFLEADDKKILYAQIFAARRSVHAERNKKETLKHKVDPKKVNDDATKLTDSAAFQSFLDENAREVEKLAKSGHGGELEEKFKDYICKMKQLPAEVPQDYMPTAKERVEGLQDKIKDPSFLSLDREAQAEYYAELMAARRSVDAERNKKETLEANVDPKKATEISNSLKNCKTFKDFLKNNPGAVRKAALSGHGGALEDQFKDYVLHLGKIPADIPKAYMPNARARTEVLQDKLKEKDFSRRGPAAQQDIYRELIATRTAVNSLRGDKKSLDRQIDPAKLQENRSMLEKCSGVTRFLENTHPADLKDAATAGHGGALEDKLKASDLQQSADNGLIPKELPDRFKPTAPELREKLRADLLREHSRYEAGSFDASKEHYMKQVAASMYLFKLEKEAKGMPVPALDAETMEKNVNKLMQSEAFRKLFAQPGATHRIAGQVADKRMSDVFTQFANNQGRFELEGHQPVLQNQPIQNQQQQQINNGNNQPVREGQNPQQEVPQQRQRAHSVALRQDRQRQLV